MLTPLTAAQQQWVDTTLNSMTLPQCVGQLLCPSSPRSTTDEWLDLIKKAPFGALSVRNSSSEETRTRMQRLQEQSPVPHVAARLSGFCRPPGRRPPATLSSKLLIDLLRTELGFAGLIISDATGMIGLTTRVPTEERVVACIKAGCDVHLFPETVQDYERLLQAVIEGRRSEERGWDAARPVLELKARLNIHRDPFGPQPSEVTIDGEWIPQGLGTDGPLQKDSQGVWSITVGPRVPDFYTYTYTVDGVRTIDPANPLIKPGSKLDFIHLIDKKGKAG